MRGWGERGVVWGAWTVATVGVATAAQGATTADTMIYRSGLVLLIIGGTALIWCGAQRNARRVMEHQERMLALTARERQDYAEMGWRAAVLEMESTGSVSHEAHVVNFPRTHPRRGA